MKMFDKLVKETQVACDDIAPGQVRVGVMFDDEANRHFITGESELRMTISYDYDPNLIIPAKKRLHKCQDVHTEVIDNGNPTEAAAMFLSYYYQRQAHMMATDEEVLAFRGHPTQFQAA